ncbi:MAG: glycogen/starch/alpha-glucan phosphorylase [Chromatiaceae bacterium]
MAAKKATAKTDAAALGLTMTQECLLSLRLALGREPDRAQAYDKYHSLALAVRRRLMDDWLSTEQRYRDQGTKRVNYLSLEFLAGRALQNAVLNLDLEDEAREAIHNLGMVLEDVYEQEHDAGLGNGGLGRLAACYLDSLATRGFPACGYGIRYEYGMFRQEIRDGWQVECPDNWLFLGNPWETPRPQEIYPIGFGGHTEYQEDATGTLRVVWYPADTVSALPYEMLIPGFRNGVANPLVLWGAVASDSFNLSYFNHGDYLRAVEEKALDETISKVLYPDDNTAAGKELRLKQQYFFVSASLQRILARFMADCGDLRQLPAREAVHLNDTHPVVAIPEWMRLLRDSHGLGGDLAWEITTRTCAYTNHTLMPEALERWDAGLFQHLLPRHVEIIGEINRRFLDQVLARWPGDWERVRRLSIFEEGDGKRIRMANLALVGTHAVNGVAQLHTDLLKRDLFPDFHALWPEKIVNITNGVTQRRWLYQANPALARFFTEAIGPAWITDLEQLTHLVPLAEDSGFRGTWWTLKRLNAQVLGQRIAELVGVEVDPQSLFDVQVKRMHEYKRQLMNVLRVLATYLRIKDQPNGDWTPRTVIIAGKAAPGYATAKMIVKLANDVARLVNGDATTQGLLKLVFLPNYGVSLAERIFPASDLSEQISTAGTEASGTGNMKFTLNGALTIGTMDGANIEICEAVGRENMFVFGLTEPEATRLKAGGYDPWAHYQADPDLKRAIDLIRAGGVSPDEPGRFVGLMDGLLAHDPYLVLADFPAYLRAQDAVGRCFSDEADWARKSILNVARIGRFSSDRSVTDYASAIWGIAPAG